MALIMSSVISRHLKHAEAYVRWEGQAIPVKFDCNGEEIVGWYRNPHPFDGEYVIFTTAAVYAWYVNGWVRVPFDEIVHYEVPDSKEESSGVRIRTRDGIRFIRFAGRSGPDGRFSDAFSLVGLLRVVVLVNKRAETNIKPPG
ncbi:hypothetical protein AB3662_29095 [Sorangium cellulosum]|uniref:hypothetical protein n=1 Tax=Sorangium cellulosum TaxID=56 RepID=UPI003D9A9D64